jgi:translation elongation factor EF-Tu-like GTPase
LTEVKNLLLAAQKQLSELPLKIGDKIRIKGHTTDLEMTVNSMQIDNAAVSEAKAGDSIGVKVRDRVRIGDKVYKITD